MFDGKVVLVTGAGSGIGRACALLLAAEGARVIVNDLGGGVSETGSGSAGPAEATVDEIRLAGGEAASNSASVSDMASVRQMVEQAMDTFGGLHAVINPAGILRDGMFHRMADEDWDAVVEVHLRGAYNVSRATIEHFRRQEEGAYVHFTSTSGLIGNLGQANYAAAKMGVIGLSRILAMEGVARNVRSNVIAPFAWTRMVATIPVTDATSAKRVERFRSSMRPEQVAQLAVALAASGASAVTGQILAARGNEISVFSQPRPLRSMVRAEGWSPGTILAECLPYLASGFTDLQPSAASFPYDAP